MKSLLFSQKTFSAPTLLAHGQIARDLERFVEMIKNIGDETSDSLFLSLLATFAVLLQCWKMGQKPSQKNRSGILHLVLRISIFCTGDNIFEYTAGLVGSTL